MYKQLSSWLLHGILMDPYAEFYVHKVKKLKTLASVPHNQDDELGIGGLSGQQIQQIQVCGLFCFDCSDVIIMYEWMKSQCFSGTAQLFKAPHILRLYAILTHLSTTQTRVVIYASTTGFFCSVITFLL